MKNITIELPVEIGDNLYSNKDGKILTFTVVDVRVEFSLEKYTNGNTCIIKIILDKPIKGIYGGDRFIYTSEIGKTMFLSKADIIKSIVDDFD